MAFDEYDLKKLRKARGLIRSVYEYNCCSPSSRKETRKLETIIRKLDALIENK